MIKKILLSSAAVAVFYMSAEAQITLNQSNVTFGAREVNMVAFETDSIPAITDGTNQSWDFSNVTVLGDVPFPFTNSTNAQFGSTAIKEQRFENMVTGRSIEYYSYMDVNSQGLFVPGFSADYQVYPIGDLTGNSADSFYVLNQTQVYTQPMYNIKFPATESSAWSGLARRQLDFELTVTNFGLNRVPGSKISTFRNTDQVAGWGRLRVPVDSLKSMWYNVLMVKASSIRIDSFYMNGSPAPKMLTDAFGVQQGATTTTNWIYFYRENDFVPLMYVGYGSDANFTTPLFGYYTSDNVAVTGIREQNSKIKTALYPNPVNGQNFNISFVKDNSADWTLNIVNMLGQQVQTVLITEGAGNLNKQIDLENTVKNGVYFVQLTDANGAVRATTKVVVNR